MAASAAPWPPDFEAILQRHLPLSEGDLLPDVPLANLGRDSLATVRLVMALEAAHSISIPDDLLVPETFATANALWNQVSALLPTLSASGG
jgi:acyl carrier protein